MNHDTVEQTPAAENLTPGDQLHGFYLASEITNMLTALGHPNPESWKSLGKGLTEEALTSPDVNIQRFLINRHWVQIFTSLPMDEIEKTRDARGCLMNGDCPLTDYVRLMRGVVLPRAIELNLLPV